MSFGESTVAAVVARKPKQLCAVSAAASVECAVCEMNCHHVGSVLVKQGVRAVGILTERDVLRRVVCAHRDPRHTTVSEVMTRGFVSISMNTPIDAALEIMLRRRLRHLPVRSDGRIVAVISASDITDWLARVHKYEAEKLLEYILMEYPR